MKQDILRLDIPVDDITIVHELNRVADLPRDTPHALLAETALFFEVVVDVPAAAELQHEVKVVLVCEEGVQLDDIGMVQVALDLDFSDQLADKFHFPFEDALWDFLDRTDEVGSLVSGLRASYRLR